MSKKRRPNSPNESENTKFKPSAVAATLSMASMLSVMSRAFSSQGQGTSSAVTDSDDDLESQSESGGGNPWTAPNLYKIKEPPKKLEWLFEHYYSECEGHDEIKIEFNTNNDNTFTEKISPLEVKHGI